MARLNAIEYNVKIWLIIGILCSVMSGIMRADTQGVVLNVDLLVRYESGDVVEGQKGVIVRIIDIKNTELWAQLYENILILNGRLRLEIKGTAENPLAVSIFENDGIKMAIEILQNGQPSGEEIVHELIYQPYAVKAVVSDKSHSTRGILGIPIDDIDISDGSVLTYHHDSGKWVPTPQDNGITELMDDAAIENSLNLISNVDIRNVNDGDVLSYQASNQLWINQIDHVLRENDVDEILLKKGYLKNFGAGLMDDGIYDEIKGFGVSVRAAPGWVNLNNHVDVKKSAIVGGTVGTSLGPVLSVHSTDILIGDHAVQDSGHAVKLSNQTTELHSSHPIKITPQTGVAISGSGEPMALSHFLSNDELSFSEFLKWNTELGQWGIGGFCDEQCNLLGNPAKLNVEGGFRFTGNLLVGPDLLAIGDYVDRSGLAKVAFTGNYSDLINTPDLSMYVTQNQFENLLSDNFNSKNQTLANVSSGIGAYVEDELTRVFSEKLVAYDTMEARTEAITTALDNYYDNDSISEFVDNGEFNRYMLIYPSIEKIEQELMSGYIRSHEVAKVARTADYFDILNAPDFITHEEYEELYSPEYFNQYETPRGLYYKSVTKNAQVTMNVASQVAQNIVSLAALEAKGYAKQFDVNALKLVATSGEYMALDPDGRPDPNKYIKKTALASNYVSASDLAELVNDFIKETEVSAVAKTGEYSDLRDAPPVGDGPQGEPHFSNLMTQKDIDETYVRISDFEQLMTRAVPAESLENIDLAPVLKRTDMVTQFNAYTQTNALHPVATSGKFSDLSGTEDLITESILNNNLSLYVTQKLLNDQLAQLNEAYFDADELHEKFKDYNANEISEDTAAQLKLEHNTKTAVNNRLDEALLSFQLGEMTRDIEFESAKHMDNEGVQIALTRYNMGHDILTDIEDRKLNQYYSKTQISDLKYVKKDENGKVRATQFIGRGIAPKGGIIMWSGSTIPNKWKLCDGGTYNGYETPDLRGRFILSDSRFEMGPGTRSTMDHFVTLSTAEMPRHNHPTTVGIESETHEHTYTIYDSNNSSNTAHHNHSSTVSQEEQNHNHQVTLVQGNAKHTDHSFTLDSMNHDHIGATINNGGEHNHFFKGAKTDDENFSNTNQAEGTHGLVADAGSSIDNVASPSGPGRYAQNHDFNHGAGHTVTYTNASPKHNHSMQAGSTSHYHEGGLETPNNTHTHGGIDIDSSDATHNHSINTTVNSSSHVHVVTPVEIGDGQPFNIQPAYYVLAFIMKVQD
jgi:hypothetical protein